MDLIVKGKILEYNTIIIIKEILLVKKTKRFFLFIFAFALIVLNTTFLSACSKNNNELQEDLFQIDVVNIDSPDITEPYKTTHTVLFKFKYTSKMFDYEIKNIGHGLLLYSSINGAEEKVINNINLMYGVKYDADSGPLAHKPNEYVYFTIELETGEYNINFKLYYADYSPYELIESCQISFNVP